jgi:hypothetical protein
MASVMYCTIVLGETCTYAGIEHYNETQWRIDDLEIFKLFVV